MTMEYSNVIADSYDLRIQRGADFEIYFEAKDADGNFIDWNTVPDVRIDVSNSTKVIVASFSIGDGLTVYNVDTTKLLLHKKANEKNLPPGTYMWDMKVPFTDQVVQYPVRGTYCSINYITA